MERFVHNEYLIHLRKQLAGTIDEAKRRQGFAKVVSWRRDDYVKKAGLATIPGATAPNSSVANTCAGVLTKFLDARGSK
jgi:hypothetical protein